MNTTILNNISPDRITLLTDVNKLINFDFKGEFKYTSIKNFDNSILAAFIDNLPNDSLFTISPFVTTSCLIDEPLIVLSRQPLVTNQSNYLTIKNYLVNQLVTATRQFNMNIVSSPS
jgi:hypothetical protein